MSKKNTYIYVVVDTDSINEQNKNEKVDFSDNFGGSYSGKHPSKFVSMVYENKNIIWCGIVKEAARNPSHRVAIKEISRKKDTTGPEILHKPPFYEQDKSGVVIGKAKSSKVPGDEDYYINLEVSKDGNSTIYHIDPKMSMP